MQVLDAETVRDLLDYFPETGKFFWRIRDRAWFKSDRDWKAWNTLYSRKETFCQPDTKGYLQGRLFAKNRTAHRVAWLHYHGKPAAGEIDHLNGIRTDNRIANLRDVPRRLNARNSCLFSHNTSGHHGVYWNKARSKWAAQIKIDGWPRHLGTFSTIEEAIAARAAADKEYGFTERHGRPA